MICQCSFQENGSSNYPLGDARNKMDWPKKKKKEKGVYPDFLHLANVYPNIFLSKKMKVQIIHMKILFVELFLFLFFTLLLKLK